MGGRRVGRGRSAARNKGRKMWVRETNISYPLISPPPVYSISWKFSLHFVHIVRTGWNFLTKFVSSNPSSNRNILTLLYLKFETYVHVQITVIHYNIFLQVSWNDMDLKLSLGYFLINEVGQWFYQLDHVTFSKNVFLFKFCTVLLPNMLHPEDNFMACLTL